MGLGDVSRLAERNESEISLFNTVASTRGFARALITREDDEIFIKLSGWCACIWSYQALQAGLRKMGIFSVSLCFLVDFAMLS